MVKYVPCQSNDSEIIKKKNQNNKQLEPKKIGLYSRENTTVECKKKKDVK